MDRKRQFSLRFLFWETFLVAAALGLFRAGTAVPAEYGIVALALIFASLCATGAALGGFSGHWIEGAALLLFLALIASLLMPAVMVA